MDVEIRDRPKIDRHDQPSVTQQLRETVTTGRAVFVVPNGTTVHRLRNSLSSRGGTLKREGLRVRTHAAEGGLYAWAEKIETA